MEPCHLPDLKTTLKSIQNNRYSGREKSRFIELGVGYFVSRKFTLSAMF